MKSPANYTLFYNAEDGKMYAGSCREEREALVDVQIGDAVEIDGYRSEGNKLILTGLQFETTADIALVVPGGTTIVLESGTSILRVLPDGPNANTATLYTKGNLTFTGGEGTLINDATHTTVESTLWSRCICARYGDILIEGGHIEALCGPCSRNAGAVYAGGRLFCVENGAEENGAITITGGTIIGASIPQSIRATNTKLTIGPNSVVENAVEFSGSEQEWHGDCLAQVDVTKPVVVRFNA